jgi:type II secretory pathway pseudopilin PulG
MKIKPAKQRKTGFTIVEVVISICILGISAAGLMSSFQYAFLAIKMARENQRATQVMLERSEAIRCFSWDNLDKVPPQTTDYYNPATQSKPVYTVYTTVAAFSPSGSTPAYAANMKQLKTVVTWTTGSIARARTNVTYIAKDGVQNYVY